MLQQQHTIKMNASIPSNCQSTQHSSQEGLQWPNISEARIPDYALAVI